MALTTGVGVAARPGRVGALGSFAVDAGRFGHVVGRLAAGDRHHRGRRYAPTGLIEYLDVGGPYLRPTSPLLESMTSELGE